MNTYSMIGATIVILALVSYTIAIFREQKTRLVTGFVTRFLTIGVILDVTATTFMIIGSSNGPFTLHGLLGYSSLAAMIIDTILIWRFFKASGDKVSVPSKLNNYTRIAYAWWVTAFVTGLLLVVLR
jgi:hypothetical protein